jgi:hypothetical protein
MHDDANPYLKYENYQADRYIGAKLLRWEKTKMGDYTQFVMGTYYIVRDKDGMYGFIGEGKTWFLNYLTQNGTWCFNPLNLNDIVWSPFYQSYIYKWDFKFFDSYIVVPNTVYREREGKLFKQFPYQHIEVHKLKGEEDKL